MGHQLNFPSPVLLAELPPKRLQILRELKSAGALSVYALAKRLGRNYSNVHGDIQRLLALGLTEKNAAGQVLRPALERSSPTQSSGQGALRFGS